MLQTKFLSAGSSKTEALKYTCELVSNIFLALNRFNLPDGSLSPYGQALAADVEGFVEQNEFAKMFFHQLKDQISRLNATYLVKLSIAF